MRLKSLHQRHAACLSAGLLLSLACAGCLSQSAAPEVSQPANWMRQGSITISSPLPGKVSAADRTMLGFLPADAAHRGTWLSIDTDKKTATLMQGNTSVISAAIKACSKLAAGSYELLLKQKEALWHAPDEYFANRHMSIPAAGDESRYLRGALGEFVLYIDRDMPMHDASIWSEEVGGIQIEEQDMARLYYQLEVGSLVEIN